MLPTLWGTVRQNCCTKSDTRRNGATTLSITTLSITTLSITTLSIMTLSITTLSITTLSITTLSNKGFYVTLTLNES